MSSIKLKVKNQKSKVQGFSLIEVLLSGAIFAVVAIVGSASLTNVLKTRAYNIKNTAVNNSLRNSLETILRETRDARYVGYNTAGHICLYDKNHNLQNEFTTDPFITDPSDPDYLIQRGLVLVPPSLSNKFITAKDITISGSTVSGLFNSAYKGNCGDAKAAAATDPTIFDDKIIPYLYIGLTADYFSEYTVSNTASSFSKTASTVAVPRN